jgi:uncharacterized protein
MGQDGAMEIRGQGHTASVYSVDSVYSTNSEDLAGGKAAQGGRNSRRASAQSVGGRPSYGGAVVTGGEQRRDSGVSVNVDQYAEEGEGSFLPYAAADEHYRGSAYQQGGVTPQPQSHQQGGYPDYFPSPSLGGHSPHPPQQQPQQQSYYPDGTPYHPQDDPRHHSQLQPSQQQQHPGYGALPPHPSAPYGHPQQQSAYHQQQPPFQPQPPHGGWGYDQAGAAAQNHYYAAATGQLGFPVDAGAGAQGPYGPAGMAQLNRAPSSMLGVGGGGSLGRSQSSLNVPGGGGGSSVRRKATTSSNGSGGSSGPPITKASVDEYRQRIKADPDPEAQFNFAKYLIEAAKKINSSASGDEKSAKKYRDALLAESLKLIKRLATQGVGLGKPAYADAQFFLANCLGNGSLGLQVDHEKAYNLYVQASKQNHSSATYRTAVCNEVGAGTRRDHARAVLFYRKASALGDTAGMYKLGMILLNGLLGQQRNPKEAFAWLKRAASQADEDNPHALHELGLLYEKPPPPNGAPSLVPYDPAQARELFTQAGQYGYPPSQFKLGSCYEYGSLTCPVDPRRSIAWYTRAAERGDAESELALSGWYLTGSEGVLKQSDSEAYLWARRAANKGLPKAEYAVGYYSEVGIGVKQDLEEAKRWYMRAAGKFASFLPFFRFSLPLSLLLALLRPLLLSLPPSPNPTELTSLSLARSLSLLQLPPSPPPLSPRPTAQGNKRAMQRLTELKKLGAEKGGRPSKNKERPTRQEAETECIIM